jgi:hypothetical protein
MIYHHSEFQEPSTFLMLILVESLHNHLSKFLLWSELETFMPGHKFGDILVIIKYVVSYFFTSFYYSFIQRLICYSW